MEDHFRPQFSFEVLDIVINSIERRFEQPGYVVYQNLQSLLVAAASGQEYGEYLKKVTDVYGDDFEQPYLSAKLESFGVAFDRKSASLDDCLSFLRGLSSGETLNLEAFFLQVCTLARLIMVMPSTNAASERSFSAMRRLNTYLRSTMTQQRLNHLMILSVHKEKTDLLDINELGNAFVQGSDHRLQQYGHFQEVYRKYFDHILHFTKHTHPMTCIKKISK